MSQDSVSQAKHLGLVNTQIIITYVTKKRTNKCKMTNVWPSVSLKKKKKTAEEGKSVCIFYLLLLFSILKPFSFCSGLFEPSSIHPSLCSFHNSKDHESISEFFSVSVLMFVALLYDFVVSFEIEALKWSENLLNSFRYIRCWYQNTESSDLSVHLCTWRFIVPPCPLWYQTMPHFSPDPRFF